jgi:hypothetical protein
MQNGQETAGAEARASAPAAPPTRRPRIVSPPEIRVAMVVRGFRRRYGGVVHLAPRANSNALCGAGHVTEEARGATESDLCQPCAALAKAGE